MTFKQFLNSVYLNNQTYQQFINSQLTNYGNYYKVSENIQTLLFNLLEYEIGCRYDNFNLLYDANYTINNVLAILGENTPKLVENVRKNTLINGTLLDNIANLGDVSNSTSQNTQSYDGLNANDTYLINNNTSQFNNANYLRSIALMDINIVKSINVIKHDIENLFVKFYNVNI